MHKKAAINPIVTFAILILFLVVVLGAFFGEGWITKAAEAAGGLADNYVGGLGREGSGLPQPDEGVAEAYESILNSMRSEAEGPCLLRYGGLPEEFNDNKISLKKSQDDIFMVLSDENGLNTRTTTIEGKVPCVVSDDAAKEFYNNYISPGCLDGECVDDYKESEILLKNPGKISVDGDEMDLEDQNLLFKTADGNVCFFPTSNTLVIRGCNYDGALYDNCLENMKKGEVLNIGFCERKGDSDAG